MKVLLLFVALFGACLDQKDKIISGKVVKVADGDTFTILNASNQQIRVRLYGIDCPEKTQDFGTRARQFTSEAVFGKTVTVHQKHKDRYGRVIAVVKTADGNTLNERLLVVGLAWHYKKHDKSVLYADLEESAKSKRLGLWSMKSPTPPWDFRQAKRSTSKLMN